MAGPGNPAIGSPEVQGIAPGSSEAFSLCLHSGRLGIRVLEERDAASLQTYGCRSDQLVGAQVENIQ